MVWVLAFKMGYLPVNILVNNHKHCDEIALELEVKSYKCIHTPLKNVGDHYDYRKKK